KNRAMMILKDIYQEQEVYKKEEEIDRKIKQSMENTQKEFILQEKIRLMREELGETSTKEEEILELRTKLNELDAPIQVKNRLEKEIKRYESIPPMSQEVSMVQAYIDCLFSIPWNQFGEEIHDLSVVQQRLDETHYGLEKVKTRIIEFLA